MTDTDTKVDLDDYMKTLNDLSTEIETYGSERRSLQDLTSSLKELHASNERVFSGVEQNLSANASMLGELRALNLSELQDEVRDRYDTHQTTLVGMATSLQQAVHEQQRAGLEMLQNAATNTQQLERYAGRVETALASQAKNQERVLAELTALSSGQETITQQLRSLASETSSIKTTLTATEKRLHVLRTLMIAALVLILAVGIAIFAI